MELQSSCKEKRLFIQMKQNSDEHTSNSPLEDDMRDLILAYVKAKNADDDAKADLLLHQINELRRLTNDK